MDAKARTKLVNVLMSKYIQMYEDKYGRKPRFNRHTEKWGFGDLVDDLGSESLAVLEYYFELKRNHSTVDLLRNSHDISEWRREDEEDEINRRELAVQTKKRVEEHLARWQQKPST